MKYLTLNLATASIGDLRDAATVGLTDTAQTARLMYNGYHLGKPVTDGSLTVQDFSFWKGPKPGPVLQDSEQARRTAQEFQTEFQTALERSFTSTNFIRELLDREIGSVFDKLNWNTLDTNKQATLKEGEDKTVLQQEADALMLGWWRIDRSHPERAIRSATTFARREERGVLRFRIGGGLLETVKAEGQDEQVTRVRSGLDMAQIARYIRLEHLTAPENCRVWEDPDTFTRHAIFAYKDLNDTESAEVCTSDGTITTLRVLKGTAVSEVKLQMGGRITYLELSLPTLITQQVLQNQMAYNTASTMILRNTELAGFIERFGVNLEPPYELVPDPETPGVMVRRYMPFKTGPGTLNLWRSATYDRTDEKGAYVGEQPLGNSDYGRFEPVSPAALTEAADHNRLNMYGEAGQTYVLMGADASASGRSREVAISDFDNIRQPVIDLAGYAVGEVLETFLALVSALANQPGHFDGLQVTGEVRARVVPPTAQERQQDLAEVQGRLIAASTARQRQGIDDSQTESAKILSEVEDGTSPSLLPVVATPPVAGAGA